MVDIMLFCSERYDSEDDAPWRIVIMILFIIVILNHAMPDGQYVSVIENNRLRCYRKMGLCVRCSVTRVNTVTVLYELEKNFSQFLYTFVFTFGMLLQYMIAIISGISAILTWN